MLAQWPSKQPIAPLRDNTVADMPCPECWGEPGGWCPNGLPSPRRAVHIVHQVPEVAEEAEIHALSGTHLQVGEHATQHLQEERGVSTMKTPPDTPRRKFMRSKA